METEDASLKLGQYEIALTEMIVSVRASTIKAERAILDSKEVLGYLNKISKD